MWHGRTHYWRKGRKLASGETSEGKEACTTGWNGGSQGGDARSRSQEDSGLPLLGQGPPTCLHCWSPLHSPPPTACKQSPCQLCFALSGLRLHGCLCDRNKEIHLPLDSILGPLLSHRSLSFLFCLHHLGVTREGFGVTLPPRPVVACQASVPTRNTIPPALENKWTTCLTGSLIGAWKAPRIDHCSSEPSDSFFADSLGCGVLKRSPSTPAESPFWSPLHP